METSQDCLGCVLLRSHAWLLSLQQPESQVGIATESRLLKLRLQDLAFLARTPGVVRQTTQKKAERDAAATLGWANPWPVDHIGLDPRSLVVSRQTAGQLLWFRIAQFISPITKI